ncbi:MAG: hypothetical protein AB1757_30400 [Acidobacteriota bacterium]
MSAIKPAIQAASIPILWMDDEPGEIEKYILMLNSEPSNIKLDLDIACSIEEARNKLRTGSYAVFIADCLMGGVANGAKFLLEVNQRRKDLPTFVYSAWLGDPRYARHLEQSLAIIKQDRDIFDRPLYKNKFFTSIYEIGKEYLKVKDFKPEIIQFKKYLENPEKYLSSVRVHWQKHGHWIEIEMKRKSFSWCVVCEEEIVDGSNDLFDFPNEQKLYDLGIKYNRIPFAYSDIFLPENIFTVGENWHETPLKNDFYPRIKAKINDIEIPDDLDTGSPLTYVSDKIVQRGFLRFFRNCRKGYILGSEFDFSTVKASLTLSDIDGIEQTREIPVAVVDGWEASAFKERNPERQVLYGRDILRAFEVEVILDSKNKITRIRFI